MQSRALVADDIEWVMDELRELPSESELFKDAPVDPDYVRLYLTSWMRQGLFGVCIPDKQAFLLAHLHRPWYANRQEVQEVLLWVPKRHRGARTAMALIRAFTELALDYEPYCITAGASLDISDNERTLKLYELCGYTRQGNGVIMRP